MTHTLVRHRDIQAWVAAKRGLPAIRRTPNEYGQLRARLTLRFAAPRTSPAQDEGLSPVSWSAWLAELDRQRLGLKIIDPDEPSFEFVKLTELH